MNKIGTYGVGDNPTQWPDVTISGRAYRRPASLRGIGNNQFVVLDFPKAADTDALIEALKPKPKSKRVSDETHE